MTVHKWLRVSLISLLIVSLLGTVMRYKIAWSLPFIDQKKFLHAHSHFAFSGWITMALMVLLVAYLAKKQGVTIVSRYQWVLWANLVCAYGMLFTFPIQGYGLYSIIFSTLSIFASYAFAIMFWRDLNRTQGNTVSDLWFKAALLWNVISSIGAFSLAWMMATKNVHQNWYLQSVYFFLHFQYNGWFFFASMGLLTYKLHEHTGGASGQKIIFWLFAGACVPAYILSVLWVHIPVWAYILVVLAAMAQVAGGFLFMIKIIRSASFFQTLVPTARWLLIISGIALGIKLLLQLGSTIPYVSHLAYGFRPIVIAYLHLVLLGIITLFLIGFMITENALALNKKTYAGIFIFTAGVLINEFLLLVQGIGDLSYTATPYINEMLFGAAFIMFSGLLSLLLGQVRTVEKLD